MHLSARKFDRLDSEGVNIKPGVDWLRCVSRGWEGWRWWFITGLSSEKEIFCKLGLNSSKAGHCNLKKFVIFIVFISCRFSTKGRVSRGYSKHGA